MTDGIIGRFYLNMMYVNQHQSDFVHDSNDVNNNNADNSNITVMVIIIIIMIIIFSLSLSSLLSLL